LSAFRLWLIRARPRKMQSAAEARRWAFWFGVSAFGFGLLYAGAGIWLVPPDDSVAHIAMITVGATLPGLSLNTLAGYRPVVLAFVVPLLLGYGMVALANEHALVTWLGTGALIYLAMLWIISANADREFRLSLQRRFEIDALNAELSISRAVAEDAAHRLALQSRELEQRVRDRTAALTTALRELESFSYSVSHDLRAPLRAINGFSHLLQEDCGDRIGPQEREYLGRIRTATERMGDLIDELLDLARLTRSDPQIAVADLSGLARSVAEECATNASGSKVDVCIQEGLRAMADPLLMRVVLQNLFMNAWKFTAGRDHPRVEFGAHPGEGQTVYFVRDNGVGFDMAYADKLFKPFQRLHDARVFAGSGIGLASVARIILRHGGRVWAESAVDAGTTIFFTLAAESAPPVLASINPEAQVVAAG
jgi:signal transduction histidine kinase